LGDWNSPFAARDPDPSEFLIQAASVIAAGSKGIMYFQTIFETNATYPDTWAAMKNFNLDVGALREYIREGDVINSVTTTDGFSFASESQVSAIRSSNAIVVIAISFANAGGYGDPECWLGENVHWRVLDHTIDNISIGIPADFGVVVDAFEVLNGEIYNASISTAPGSVVMSDVYIDNTVQKRIFVLANTPTVRSQVQQNLATALRR
jgi:hypothetical protein